MGMDRGINKASFMGMDRGDCMSSMMKKDGYMKLLSWALFEVSIQPE
jgi:hypothetical protein